MAQAPKPAMLRQAGELARKAAAEAAPPPPPAPKPAKTQPFKHRESGRRG